MRALDGFQFTATANDQAFDIPQGGQYLVDVIGSNFGTVEIQRLGPDGTTYLSLYAPFNNAAVEADLIIGKFAANGSKVLFLAQGAYRIAISSATAVSVSIARNPGE